MGALKSTPTNTLEIECGLKPLKLRREELTLKYYVRSAPLKGQLPVNDLLDDQSAFTTTRCSNIKCYSSSIRQLKTELHLDKNLGHLAPPAYRSKWDLKLVPPSHELTNLLGPKKDMKTEETKKGPNANIVVGIEGRAPTLKEQALLREAMAKLLGSANIIKTTSPKPKRDLTITIPKNMVKRAQTLTHLPTRQNSIVTVVEVGTRPNKQKPVSTGSLHGIPITILLATLQRDIEMTGVPVKHLTRVTTR